MQMSKKTALSTAVLLSLGSAGAFADHVSGAPGTFFTYNNGSGNTVGTPPASGSWFSMLAIDTDSDYYPDTNAYTAMRGTIATAPQLDAYTAPTGFGYLDFDVINTITTGAGGTNQNTGNMITRDWNFFGSLGSEFTTTTLALSGGCNQASTSCTLDMSPWRVTWNGIPSINMGGGAPAVIARGVDGLWNTGDDTLDYSAVVPIGDPSGFGGVAYGVHMVGSFNPVAVPVPAAAWLFGSGLMGLAAVARRKKKA